MSAGVGVDETAQRRATYACAKQGAPVATARAERRAVSSPQPWAPSTSLSKTGAHL